MVQTSTKQTITVALAAVMVFAWVTSCRSDSESERILRLAGETMGTTWHATLLLEPGDQTDARRNMLLMTIEAQLREINASMSTYENDSDLSRLAKAPANLKVQLEQSTWDCWLIARRVHRWSRGAFDPTVGPLVRLWGFGPDRRLGEREHLEPSEADIQQALQWVGLDKLAYSAGGRTVKKPRDEMELDFSAIAKGFAAEEIARALVKTGIANFLIEVGGEICVRGQRPGGGSWKLHIESPWPDNPQWGATIEWSEGALATSGDYRNFRILPDGSRVSHTIDPRTGRPVSQPPASASVLASHGALADAWATALSVLGEEGLPFVEEQPALEARLVLHPAGPDESPRVLTTSGWPGQAP